MKSRLCPYCRLCFSAGRCETCDFEKAFEKLDKKIKRLQAQNEKLTEENNQLKEKRGAESDLS